MQIWVNPQSGTQISDTRDAKTKLPEEYLIKSKIKISLNNHNMLLPIEAN